jgi:hypothetical protein
VHLIPDTQDENEARQLRLKFFAGAQFVSAFWKRKYDVDFDIYESDEDPHPLKLSIFEKSANTRANSGNLYIRLSSEDPKIPGGDIEFHHVMLHEFGHRVGLPDEYVDAECQDRDQGEPDSIMNNEYQPLGTIRFHSRHIEAIFSKMCGKIR